MPQIEEFGQVNRIEVCVGFQIEIFGNVCQVVVEAVPLKVEIIPVHIPNALRIRTSGCRIDRGKWSRCCCTSLRRFHARRRRPAARSAGRCQAFRHTDTRPLSPNRRSCSPVLDAHAEAGGRVNRQQQRDVLYYKNH